MGRRLNIVFLATIAIAAMLQSSLAQTIYVVGDALGWTIPPGPAVYTTWAANKTFRVGDTLVFNFANGIHNVAEVTRANFDACNATNSLLLLSNSPANVTVNETGDHYFLCAVPRHCSAGQKLAINVSAAASSPAPQPSTPAPQPATPPPASTPRPSTPASSPQAASPSPISAPTPAPTRSPVTPTPSSSSPSPSPSSSPSPLTPTPPSFSPPSSSPSPSLSSSPPTPTPPSSSSPSPSTATPPPPTTSSAVPPNATPPTPGNSATSLGVAGLSATFLCSIVAFFI